LVYLGKKKNEVSVHCVGKQKIQTLNRVFRGIDRPTDVLSFPAEALFGTEDVTDSGDLFLCPAYIAKQAKRFETSYKEEFFRMLIHGVLHLEGYDHEKKTDAKKMFAVQERLLTTALKKI